MSKGVEFTVPVLCAVGLAGSLAMQATSVGALEGGAVANSVGVHSVLAYGAIGNGTADDTNAIRDALNAAGSGGTVIIPAGRVFRHTGVLSVNRPGVRVTGGGTLLATNEEKSSFLVNANRVAIDHVTFAMATTTKRWETYDQMKLRIGAVDGVVIDHVRILGSAAAGVYVGGATNFRLNKLYVADTRADGIHITGSSRDGVVRKPRIKRPGDDGVAVVSYAGGGSAPVSRIKISGPKVYDQVWGRAFSVVGGDQITWKNIYARRSSGASLYIASESNYNTQASTNVQVDGGTIDRANTSSRVDHGAVLLYNGNRNVVNRKIRIKNLRIRNTRRTASRNVAVLSSDGGRQSGILLAKVRISGRPAPFATNVSAREYKLKGWTYRGRSFRAK